MSEERFGKWKWLAPVGSVAILMAGYWFVGRAGKYGLRNVFFRDHHFTDGRQLAEDVAIDLTKKTLAAEGIEVSAMEPQRFWPNDPRLYATDTVDRNSGYVLWGDPHRGGWEYKVWIHKNGSHVRGRVYRPK